MLLISLGVTLELQLEEGIEMELNCKFLFLWISSKGNFCLSKIEYFIFIAWSNIKFYFFAFKAKGPLNNAIVMIFKKLN